MVGLSDNPWSPTNLSTYVATPGPVYRQKLSRGRASKVLGEGTSERSGRGAGAAPTTHRAARRKEDPRRLG